jgi:hypothetical protein
LPKTRSILSSLLVFSSQAEFQLTTRSQSHIAIDGQSTSKSWCRAPSGAHDQILLFDSYGLVFVGRPLWREEGSVFCICCWFSPAQSFSGPSPLDLATIFYCLSFATSLFVASYDSQGHGGGIPPRLHTGICSYLCLHLLKIFFRRPSREHLVEGFDLSVVKKTTPPLRRKRLSIYAFSRERVCHTDNDTGNLLTEPLSSNGRQLRFRYSGTPQYLTVSDSRPSPHGSLSNN